MPKETCRRIHTQTSRTAAGGASERQSSAKEIAEGVSTIPQTHPPFTEKNQSLSR